MNQSLNRLNKYKCFIDTRKSKRKTNRKTFSEEKEITNLQNIISEEAKIS